MRVNDVKATPRRPPRCRCIPELVDPPWALEWLTDLVIGHAGPVVIHALGEDVDVMPPSQLLDQRNRIAFRTTTRG